MGWLRDRLRSWLCPELVEDVDLLPEEVEDMVIGFRMAEEQWKRLQELLHEQNEQMRRSLH